MFLLRGIIFTIVSMVSLVSLLFLFIFTMVNHGSISIGFIFAVSNPWFLIFLFIFLLSFWQSFLFRLNPLHYDIPELDMIHGISFRSKVRYIFFGKR